MITITNLPRYARIFRTLCLALIPIMLLGSPLMLFYILNPANFSLAQRAGLACIELINCSMPSYGLILLARIANNFQNDEIFTTKTVALFTKLQKVIGYWALYIIGSSILLLSVFTPPFPAYDTYTLIATSGILVIILLFIFLFLSILATLIVKATQLQGDQDLTV